MPTVTIAQLKHFLLVADTANYRQAAERACRSQSAISRSVQELEQRLGTRLFEGAHRVNLSPAGNACLPVARDLVERFDRALAVMDDILSAEHGTLSVGSTFTAATRLMPDIVSAFRKQHPRVDLRLVDDNSSKLRDMVKSGELDWALCSLPEPDPKLAFVTMLADPFGFVCTTSHPFADRAVLRWSDLTQQPLIRTTVHDQLRNTVAQPLLDQSTLFVSTMISVWALLKAGEGVTVLPLHSAPEPGNGLVYIPLHEPVLQRTMGLLRLADGNVTVASRAFEVVATAYFRRLASQSMNASGQACARE
jgi:DNA-binding transcriptional LysR family regulator